MDTLDEVYGLCAEADDELETPSYLDSGDKPDRANRADAWADLGIMREALNSLGDIDTIRKYIKLNLSEEVEELRKNFERDFKHTPKDDLLRLEVLQTLGEMGVIIYH